MEDETLLYNLLAAYFSGEVIPSEKETVEQWRAESLEHEELFQHLRKQWESVKQDTSSFVIPDKSAVWDKIQQTIRTGIRPVQLYTRALLLKVAGVAAAVALFTGFTFAYLISGSSNKSLENILTNVVLAPSGQKSQLVLPDGTEVWLNSGSKLTYDSHYAFSDRVVKLEGEAYFDVKQNKEIPFIVKTDKMDVKVHGTAFNVNAYADESNIAVTLQRGSVSLISPSDGKLLTCLLPDQSAIVSRSSGKFRVIDCDALSESCWHLNLLKFEGDSADEVWKKLGRWYGVRIKLENVPSTSTYWFTVKTESLTELLSMINRLTPVEYKLNGEEVTVRYK